MAAHVWLCEECCYDGDGRFMCGSVARDGICARCGGLAPFVLLRECQDPRSGGGVLAFSTCVAIESARTIVWDVNCYYRDLGVASHASRKEIREAYQAAQGWESERLTYVVKQLLNPVLRAAYDLCKPGWLFMDAYVVAAVKRGVEDDIRRHFEDGGRAEQLEKLDLSHLEDQPFQVFDRPEVEEHDDGPRSRWGHYFWQSGCRDAERLAGWRSCLVEVYRERLEVVLVGVGFCGKHMQPVEVTEVGNLPVFFLNECEQPSTELARQAVDRVAIPNTIPNKETVHV